jgi:hypothetical protein
MSQAVAATAAPGHRFGACHLPLKPMRKPLDPWQEYRRRRTLVLFAYILYLPLVFATAWAADRLIHTSAPAIVVGPRLDGLVSGDRHQMPEVQVSEMRQGVQLENVV